MPTSETNLNPTILNFDATNILSTKPDVDSDMVAQQSGVNLRKDGQSCIHDPRTISNSKNREKALAIMATPEEIPINFEVGSKLETLLGMSKLIGELRELLFNLDGIHDLKRKGGAIESEEVAMDKTALEILISQHPRILDEYMENQARISLLLEIINELDDDNQKFYKDVTSQLNVWQEVLQELLPNLSSNEQYVDLIKKHRDKNGKNNVSEKERLTKLITGERSITKQQKLKTRVRLVLLGNSSLEQKNKVSSDFSDEFLRTALAVNELRVIHRVEEEGKKKGFNLVDTRNKIDNLKQSKQTAEQLNKELQDLLIPIANVINDVFPHDSATGLSAVLAKGEAVCTGKTNALLVVLKFLGLNARNQNILITLRNSNLHTTCEVSLFGNKQLVVDANYGSFHHLKGTSNDKLREIIKKEYPYLTPEQIEQTFNDFVLYRANAPYISNNSNVLIYSTSPKQDTVHQYEFTRIHPNGKKQVWFANIPHPHLLTASDKDGQLVSSDTYYNFGNKFRDHFNNYNKAKKYFEKAIEINPNNAAIHNNLAFLLENHCQDLGMEKKEALFLAKEHYEKFIKLANKTGQYLDYIPGVKQSIAKIEEYLKA